jgi:transcriptional regulator with XRE-family HTH domain
MNDPRLGGAIRALRRRRDWRQLDLADAAGVSRSLVSAIECGRVEALTLGTVRAVAASLDATIAVELRWRGGALDRLLDERHAQLSAAVAAVLEHCDWRVRPEVSYSTYGERGSIDLVGWHDTTRTLLIVEVKTELTSLEATLRKHDEKVRLGPRVVGERFGWRPTAVGRVLVLPATTTSHRHVQRHATTSLRRFRHGRGRFMSGSGRRSARWPGSSSYQMPATLALSRERPPRTASDIERHAHRMHADAWLEPGSGLALPSTTSFGRSIRLNDVLTDIWVRRAPLRSITFARADIWVRQLSS